MLTLAVPRILTAHYPYVRTYVYVCGILTVHRSFDRSVGGGGGVITVVP